MFKWKMRSHFKAIQAKSEAQYANYMTKNKENKDAWESLSASEKVKLDNRNSYSIQEGLISDKVAVKAAAGVKPKKKGCCASATIQPYNRMILEDQKKNGNYAANNQILIDHIEVNGILTDYIYYKSIAKMTDDIIMVSFSMLYAGVCPVATLVIFCYFCITNRLEEYQDLNIYSRPEAIKKPSLALWGSCIEIIVIFIVILNSLMLYIVSPSFKALLGQITDVNQVLLVFGVEHLLIAFLVGLKFGISDVPKSIENKMTLRIRKSKNSKGGTPEIDEHEAARRIIKEYREEKVIKPAGKLVEFLPFDYREWLEDETAEVIDRALKTNLELKLYHETFVVQERSILHRRMHSLCTGNKFLMINCVECSERTSVIECADCLDNFCQRCSDIVHNKSEYFKNHLLKPVPLTIEAIPASQGISEGQQSWRKFEYFNFPVPNTNDLFAQLQIHFERLKKLYVTYNYIGYDGEIDLGSLFVDQNYDCLERKDGRAMKQKHIKKFGRMPLHMQREKVEGTSDFNDEELFYMNRIAFRLFKLRGCALMFKAFIDDIMTLQCGTYNARITLWLLIVNESEETLQKVAAAGDLNLNATIITRQKFNNVVRMSYPQDASKNRRTYEDIVYNKIFKGTEAKPMSELIKICETDADATALMKCVLQVMDDK